MIKIEQTGLHIAIIMDGNGRWATERGFSRTEGHKKGVEVVNEIIKKAHDNGVKYLTLYTFSTENWKRPKLEIKALFSLFKRYLIKERETMKKDGVKLVFSGRREGIEESLLKEMDKTVEYLSEGKKLILNIAFNYGGRAEITDAVNKILKEKKEKIEEGELQKYLYNNLPDPEILIRTGGDYRISNFLLWQMAYTEIFIIDKYWPDFGEEDLKDIIEKYRKRNRRFGGIG